MPKKWKRKKRHDNAFLNFVQIVYILLQLVKILKTFGQDAELLESDLIEDKICGFLAVLVQN